MKNVNAVNAKDAKDAKDASKQIISRNRSREKGIKHFTDLTALPQKPTGENPCIRQELPAIRQ